MKISFLEMCAFGSVASTVCSLSIPVKTLKSSSLGSSRPVATVSCWMRRSPHMNWLVQKNVETHGSIGLFGLSGQAEAHENDGENRGERSVVHDE